MSALLEPPVAEPPAESATERLERLIVEQGVAETATAEHLAKAGEGLWDSDEEFDDFLAILRNLRRDEEPMS